MDKVLSILFGLQNVYERTPCEMFHSFYNVDPVMLDPQQNGLNRNHRHH